MNSRLATIYLSVALVLSLTIFIGSYTQAYRFPGNHEGYEPVQPIAFSHRLHAGELQISCFHCHGGSEESRHAGIPSVQTCMNCHRFITAPFLDIRAEEDRAAGEDRKPERIVSPEIRKIYDVVGLDEELKPQPMRPQRSIEWIKVHNLPEFVYFDHRAHVGAGVQCQTCHGPVETMERVRQVVDLSMGWCVNCHRQANVKGIAGKRVNASTDCVACHY